MYAVYVEYKTHHLQQDEEFSSLCDIEALNASCRCVTSTILSLDRYANSVFVGQCTNMHQLD